MRPSALSVAASSHDQQERRDRRPCRARGPGRRSSRAPPRSRTRGPSTRPIHLKPVSVSSVRLPGRLGHLAEQRRRHDRTRRTRRVRPGRSRWSAEQRADLVAAQHPPAVRPGHRDRAPVGVRVVGDHDVGPDLRGQRHREVHRARLLRVRERRPSGSRGRARPAATTTCGAAKPARSSAVDAPSSRRRRAAACRRCVRSRGAVAGQAGDARRGRRRGRRRRAPRQPSPRGTVGERADRVDRGGDLGVGRRHDLAAVAEVDLVAVVLRRVVARGHHHAGDAAEVADREGQQRAWAAAGAAPAREPGAGHHLGGVAREDVGVVAGVVPDHDGVAVGRAVVARGTPRARPRRGSRRRGSSGSGRRPAPRAAPRCRTRGCPRTGRPGRRGPPRRRTRCLDEGAELGPGLRVGILGGPRPGPLQQVARIAHSGRLTRRVLPCDRAICVYLGSSPRLRGPTTRPAVLGGVAAALGRSAASGLVSRRSRSVGTSTGAVELAASAATGRRWRQSVGVIPRTPAGDGGSRDQSADRAPCRRGRRTARAEPSIATSPTP